MFWMGAKTEIFHFAASPGHTIKASEELISRFLDNYFLDPTGIFFPEAQKDLFLSNQRRRGNPGPAAAQSVTTSSVTPAAGYKATINIPDISLLWLHPAHLGYEMDSKTRYQVYIDKSWLNNDLYHRRSW